tara:strand:+ start:6939 stop:7496 length:558 start_codon:yes stop_codon:yes gene_type:complete
MKDFPISLKQDVEYLITYPGSAFHVQDAAAPVTLRFDNGDSITRQKTQGAVVSPFQRVTLLSSVDQVVVLTLGDGISFDGRSEVVSATINTTIEVGDSFGLQLDVAVGLAATQIAAADANRKELLIHVPSSSTDSIRVGGASVAVNRGFEVEPGSSLVLSNESAVYAISTGAGSVTVSLLDSLKA